MNVIKKGFESPVYDSQTVFRQLLKAMSEPVTECTVPVLDECPDTLNLATYSVALTLFDQDTQVFLTDSIQSDDVKQTLRFHTALKLVDAVEQADFVLCNEHDMPKLAQLKKGNNEYPDQSCILVIQSDTFNSSQSYQATGPGIKTVKTLSSSALTEDIYQQRNDLHCIFPLGIDVVMTHKNRLIALPRTTQLEAI